MVKAKQNGEYLAPRVKVVELSTRETILLSLSGDTSDEGGGGGGGGYAGRDEDPGWFD